MNKPPAAPTPSSVDTAALYFTERLTNALAAIHTRPLTLVEAPMGYGKTVAVREYLRESQARVVWTSVLSAGGEDAFWRDFCRSIARAFPNDTETVESLSRLGYPRDAVLANAARELLQQLDFSPETILVIDDIHFLPDSGRDGGITGLCDKLARSDIGNLHLVLISRDTWIGGRDGRGLADLKGFLAIIDRDVLALTTEEIREYYTRCGLPVSLKDAAALRRITGGWISALHLYLLRHSKDGGSIFVGEGLARPESMDELLDAGIFSLLPEASRELLLTLSPLDRFTREQAAFLFDGNGDVSAVLLDLQRKNSFIAYDTANGTYALHSLFRQYLQERFGNLPAERQKAVYSRMADWFIRQKDASSAIEACHAAGEYERALEILESDMSRNFVTEKARFFVDLFAACPEEVKDRHMGAAFKYAIAAFAAGNYQAFGGQLAWIGKKCAARVAEKGEDDPEAKIWRGELEFLLSLAAYNDIRGMSDHHRKANELLGRPTRQFGPESPWTLGCPSVLFMFHRTPGKLDEELADMDECLPHYYTLASMHGAGGEHQMRAEALYNQGDFTNAAVSCHRALAMARGNNQLSVMLACRFLLLRLALLDGNYEKATGMAREMHGLIREKRDFFLLHTVDMCESWLHAFTGELHHIPDWLRFGAGEEGKLYTFAGGYYYVIHGHILLLAGEYAAVTGLFTWLLQSGAFANHLMFTVYAHIYMAAANTALGRQAEARAALRAALDLALPDKLYMPFAENADFLPQLKDLRRKKSLREGLTRILDLSTALEKSRKSIAARYFADDTPPLSKRERELVRLALTDMAYKDIAAACGLAPSSVKRYFAALYKKLGISSREQLQRRFL